MVVFGPRSLERQEKLETLSSEELLTTLPAGSGHGRDGALARCG